MYFVKTNISICASKRIYMKTLPVFLPSVEIAEDMDPFFLFMLIHYFFKLFK